MKQVPYRSSLEVRVRTAFGGEGACKALVFGHGEFDPHLTHKPS